MKDPRVIVALDYEHADEAFSFVSKVDPSKCCLKVGNEMFTAEGPSFVRFLVDKGFKVFLDLKFHDIPNTVSKACLMAARMGVWMVNVHASGGSKMMTAACETLSGLRDRPLLIGVTVLTSMDREQLEGIGINKEPIDQVLSLARLVSSCGLDGTVSSPREVSEIKKACGKDFLCVTPGVRPKGVAVGDQIRITTPFDAIRGGSDYLVIGRPITKADDPLAALEAINSEVERALV